MNFQDIFKSKFINQNQSGLLSPEEIIIVLVTTFIMSAFIYWIYKKTFQGVLYSRSFNISLMMVALITAMVIMTISSNLILSLGMVGALSIVRFRTAIKDPIDVVFMFWAIAVGITNGAKYFLISILASIIIAIILFTWTRFKSKSAPYLLILKYHQDQQNQIQQEINKLKKYAIKSKVIANDNVELTLEIRVWNDDTSFLSQLSKLNGVQSAVLISNMGAHII